jgi:hypothetical protein
MAVNDGRQELRDKWEALLDILFQDGIPDSAEWTDSSEIARVLNVISSSINHVFHPEGGGEDLVGAQITREGNLEWSIHEDGLKTFANVVRPVKLTFWNPGKQNHEANFVLEVSALEPVGRPQDRSEYVEELTEIRSGVYEPLSSWENSQTQRGDDLPEGARRLCRVIKPARFAIFGKGSIYNSFKDKGFDAYQAHHNDPAEFKKIVGAMAEVDVN